MSILEKEKEVKLSKLKHIILESELNLLKKEEECKRLAKDIDKYKLKLSEEMDK